MNKIRIKGLVQGKKKMKDGSFAVGFRTKWGIVWVAPGNLHKFTTQNRHLSFLMLRSTVEEEELIGRFINVTDKAAIRVYKNTYTVNPRL